MKKLLQICAVLGLFFSMTSATCSPDTPEPTLKDYTCQCTYVPMSGSPSDSLPNKEETTTVKAEDNFAAGMECDKLESKWGPQYFVGNCLIQ